MKLIVGLGNPGKKYEKTRHNLGFMVADELIQNLNLKFRIETKFKAEVLEMEYGGEKIILAKPLTFMNNSGQAVSLISKYFNIQTSDIWVIHDDVDFPLGVIKIKFGGASAGHHGVESIIESIGTEEFWRFRMGIGRPEKISNFKFQISNDKNVEDYVLEEFRSEERELIQEVIKRGVEAIKTGLDEGMDVAMNKYNTR